MYGTFPYSWNSKIHCVLQKQCHSSSRIRHIQSFSCQIPTKMSEEASLVFLNAENEYDESIEVVPTPTEESKEREDILQAENLPNKTVNGLFYSSQDNLNTHKDKVKSKPLLDEKIQKGITNLNEILHNPSYGSLHPVGEEVQVLLSGAVKYANESGTSLKAARELLDKSLEIYKVACESSADKFELSNESTNALAEHARIERERLELLIKKRNLTEANLKREEGLEMIEKSIEAAKVDTVRVITKQAQEEQEKVLVKFAEQKSEIEDQIDTELDSLHLISHNCEGDIDSIEKSLEILEESAEAAFNKYTEKDKELCLKLQENRKEQEELRKRLDELCKKENAFENERDERTKTQGRAEKTKDKAKEELEDWKYQIEELHRCCQAALTVLSQFREGAFKLINKSIEYKEQEDKRLQEQDALAHRTFRDAMVAACVSCKEIVSQSDEALAAIAKRIEENKKKHRNAVKSNIQFEADELKETLKKMKENRDKFKSQKAQNEMKLEDYKKDIAATDERLQALGQVLESLDVIYERYQRDVEAAWDQEADDDNCSLNSLDSV